MLRIGFNVAEPTRQVAAAAGGVKRVTSISLLAHEYTRQRTQQGIFTGTTPRTISSILHRFTRAIGPDREPGTITRRDLEAWLERDIALSTKRNQFSAVRTWLRWMVERGYIKKDPSIGVRMPRQPRSVPHRVDDEQVSRLLAVAPDARAQLIILLMSESGLRCAEVATLEVGDVDTYNRVVKVTGKGGHQREVPLCPNTATALRRYLEECPAVTGPLIRSYASARRALTPQYISQRVRHWMTLAGLRPEKVGAARGRHPSAHWMRHGCAQAALEAGADPRTVQTLLGHQSLSTTSRYTGLANMGEMRKAMEGRQYGTRLGSVGGTKRGTRGGRLRRDEPDEVTLPREDPSEVA